LAVTVTTKTMKNSHTITVLTIFILVFSVTMIALTLEVSHSVFAAKKNKSEDKSTPDAATSTPSSSQVGSKSGDGGNNDILNSLSLPCPDGSIPVKGKCPLPPSTIPPDDSTKSKLTKPSTSESSSTDSGSSNTLTPLPPATDDTNTGSSKDSSKDSNKHRDSNTDSGSSSDSSTATPLSLPCPDGSIPVKGKCPPPLAAASEDTSGTKNKHKSEDKSTPDASTPTIAVGESNSNARSTTSSKSNEDMTNGNAKRVDSSSDGSTTTPTLPTASDSSNQDSSSIAPPPPPTTSDSSNIDGSKDSGKDSSSNNTPLPSIIPSNQGAGGTDTGSTGGGSNTDSGGSSSNSGGSTKPSSTTSGSGSSGSTSSSSSGTSSSSTTNTKPTNSKKTPQTSVSQSAAIAATNQIINSPGSTILNQQSIKQSVKINNEINNIIRKNVISQSSSSSTTATTTPREISNLITVKLATTSSTMSRNAYLPIADVAPYHLIGGHVTANLPNNHLNVVVAQLSSSNGAIEHAVVLDMIKSQISNIFETDLGSQISGTNPLTGKQDTVSGITNLFLWNNGNQQVTFVDANAVTMNLIYK
jgi:hypothetical protein